MAIYYSDKFAEPPEAFFAGRLFVLSACEKALVAVDTEHPPAATRVFLNRIDGAFLYRDGKKHGWLLVFGAAPGRSIRPGYWDDGKDQLTNALALQKLGIPVLSFDQASANLKSHNDARVLNFTTLERKKKLPSGLLFNEYKSEAP